MPLTYTGTGGIWTRLGRLIKEYNRTVSGYGSSLNAGVEDIWEEYPDSEADASAIDGLLTARDAYRSVHSSYTNSLLTAVNNTLVSQVDREGAPLATRTASAAVAELRTQMLADAETINRPTTSVSVSAAGSNAGNSVVNASLTNQYGDPLDLVFDENVKLTVTADAANGGTQYGETLSVQGEPLLAATDYRWPGGSGATGSLRLTDASVTGLLTDGSFETWVGSTPTYWSVTAGAATVDKNSTAANVVRGTYALAVTSDGSTLTTFRQQLSTSVAPNTVYCLNLWAKMSALDASGVVRFRLTNSAGTTLTNDAGDSLSYTRNTNGQIDTSFTQVSTFFQTPRSLPSSGGVWLEVGYTTAPASGRILYLDHLGLAAATPLYAGGPFVAGFSKDTASAVRDSYPVAVTNSLDHNSFARALDRLLGLRSLGTYLPSSGSPTISDSLITS